MDLADPTRSIAPSLDTAILAVLAAAGRPLTVGEVTEKASRGSEIGIRRSMGRLVEQGIVKATEMGRNRVHELNVEHVAAPIAKLLADLRIELWQRMRKELGGWSPKPSYACVFGSAARRDGGPESDIDVLLVHPPFPGEKRRKRPSRQTLTELAGDIVEWWAIPPVENARALQRWQSQVDRLHGLVGSWSGNRLQVVDVSIFEWTDKEQPVPLFIEIRRDAIPLVGAGFVKA
ncbi:MAG TPA: nucleotidyltransferase domain-containing protein [Acidimicrobiales bacterium]|nr:nucleotidyltransferase domain-containing protein [Acidimicrobiales bacterium]